MSLRQLFKKFKIIEKKIYNTNYIDLWNLLRKTF